MFAVVLVVVMIGCGDDGGGEVAVDAAVPVDAPVLPSTCSTEAQDCPAGTKCTLTLVMTSPPIQRRCLPMQGTVAEGGACRNSPINGVGFGHDDCDVGLFCNGVCRKLCTSSASCGADQGCAQYATASDGLCRDRCELVTAGECPSGETCDSYQTLDGPFAGYCRQVGSVPPGGNCFQGYCGLNQGCDRDGRCAAICNAEHPCASGGACDIAPFQADYGTCPLP